MRAVSFYCFRCKDWSSFYFYNETRNKRVLSSRTSDFIFYTKQKCLLLLLQNSFSLSYDGWSFLCFVWLSFSSLSYYIFWLLFSSILILLICWREWKKNPAVGLWVVMHIDWLVCCSTSLVTEEEYQLIFLFLVFWSKWPG